MSKKQEKEKTLLEGTVKTTVSEGKLYVSLFPDNSGDKPVILAMPAITEAVESSPIMVSGYLTLKKEGGDKK